MRIRRLGWAATFVLITALTPSATASAAPRLDSPSAYASVPLASCPDSVYHYAMQITGTSSTFNHDGCVSGTVYEGWNGIDGQITTPAASANLGDVSNDHAIGWLGMISYQPIGLIGIRIGWQTGELDGNIIPNGQYELFLVAVDLNGYRTYLPLSPLSLGAAVIYRISYAGGGCWQAYYNYSTPAGGQICNLPESMSAQATNELANFSGLSSTMPQSVFGYSNPNTNNALRLHGASGWRPWTTDVGTLQSDLRIGGGPYYYISDYNSYYKELTYGG